MYYCQGASGRVFYLLFLSLTLSIIINITVEFISIINTIAKMSDSSLSLPPQSEMSLPALLSILLPTLQLRYTTNKPKLASTDSDLFTLGLFSCMLLETAPPTIQLCCLQPGCLYTPKPQLLSFNQTSNYWSHYYHMHPQVAEVFKLGPKSNSQGSSQGS
jgi:hypothetical protein